MLVMNKVVLEDIVGNAAYEKKREQSRQRIIEIKRRRRVSVGNQVTLLFENRDTVIFQIQEMMRAEKISDLDKIREEIDVYNELIPASGELSATLFLEIEDQTHLRQDLLKFLGIDESVYLKVGNHSVNARFEEVHSKEAQISTENYVKFPFSEAMLQAFVKGEKTELVIDHPNYQARTVIGPDTRQSLVEDLTA